MDGDEEEETEIGHRVLRWVAKRKASTECERP